MDAESPYDSGMIKPIRPPEVEGGDGEWRSRWLLRLNSPPSNAVHLRAIAAGMEQIEGVYEVELIPVGNADLRLDIRSVEHPMQPDAYPMIDTILRRVDSELGGLSEINGSPRDWWRTFRSSGSNK